MTEESPVHDLQPSGGTPVSKWFSCCLPKSEDDLAAVAPTNKKRHITFDDEPKEITDTREVKLEMDVEEEDEVDEIPNMDDPNDTSESNKAPAPQNNKNWLEQFFAMMFQLLFLQFIRDAQNKKRIKNQAE